jgi:hypothetical protein
VSGGRLAVGAALAALVLVGAEASARAARVAILVGDNVGESDEARLRYAEEDAAKLARVLRELGGFQADDLILLRNEGTDAARRAIIRVNDRLRREGAGRDSLLVVYYSGHADASALHLAGTRFPVDELEALVRGSPAGMRLLIVDACRSGALTRVKGGKPAPPFDVQVRRADPSEGAVFFTASAANEDAQESDALRGSFFTHYLVSGLRGAADGDGDQRVSLSEAYAYAYDGTLRASSRSLGGTQHPTYSYELRGHEDVVLTTLTAGSGRALARLTLPPARTYLVLQDGPDGAVVAETSSDAASRRLALPPGRYFVRGRGRDDLLEGSVTLRADDDVAVREPELERVAYARLVRKGGGGRERLRGVHAGYWWRSALWRGADPCQGAFAAAELVTSAVSWAVRASGCRGGFSNESLSATTDDLDVQLEGARAWDLRRASLHVGLGLGPALLSQTFDTRGAAPSRRSLAATLTAGAGVEVPLPRGFVVDATIAAAVYGFEERRADGATAWTTSVTGLGRLGLGLRF